MRYMPSGGAGVSLPVLHFFEDIGIPICEGYGLTETCKFILFYNTSSYQNNRLRLFVIIMMIIGRNIRVLILF